MMNLKEHLHDCTEADMQEYIENNININDPDMNLNNDEIDHHYELWEQEFVNSETEWWRFNLTSLNYYHFEELLGANSDLSDEFGIIDQPTDVKKLLRNYGYFWIRNGKEHYMELFTENIAMLHRDSLRQTQA